VWWPPQTSTWTAVRIWRRLSLTGARSECCWATVAGHFHPAAAYAGNTPTRSPPATSTETAGSTSPWRTAAPCPNTSFVSLLISRGDGSFDRTDVPLGFGPYSIATDDLDRTGPTKSSRQTVPFDRDRRFNGRRTQRCRHGKWSVAHPLLMTDGRPAIHYVVSADSIH